MRTSFDRESWRGLYVAALFEPDSAKLPDRIAEAEKALVVRARELFVATGDHVEEKQALNDTMCALRAFRNARHCGVSSLRTGNGQSEQFRPSEPALRAYAVCRGSN